MLAPVLDRALALVSTGKNAKDLGLTQLTQLVKDVKACAIYFKATALAATTSASASVSASASGSTGGGAAATTNGKGKKSQSSTNAPSKDASAAAPADITTPYTPLSPPAISALPPVDLTALGLMSALKLLFTEALHSAFPQVPS